MKKFLVKIFRIIISNFYYRLFKKNEFLYQKRIKICRECSMKKTHKLLKEYCSLCGCPLAAKLRCKEEHCKINKW